MGDKSYLVVAPAKMEYDKEQRYIVKAGAPNWVKKGARLSRLNEIKDYALGICSGPLTITLVFLGTATHVQSWMWPLDGLSLIVCVPLAVGLRKALRERYDWVVELGSQTAAELVDGIVELQSFSNEYSLDNKVLGDWENYILAAARSIDDIATEVDSLREKLAGCEQDKDSQEYASALRERISELEGRITPVKNSTKELVSQVKQLGYAKKAAELKGLSLAASPDERATLSLLDEVDRVKALTAAYVELSALSVAETQE